MSMTIPWGAKVSDTFIDRLAWVVDDLDIGHGIEDGVGKMMGCIAWESGRTFDPSIINKAGSGATGLIQFMPATAQSLGTTTAKLAKMTAEDQLMYVWEYFKPYRGKLKTLGDIYAAILWPAGVGKPEDYVYWDKATKPKTYRQNAGIDANKNGVITKAEATKKVQGLYEEGFKSGNVREYEPDPYQRNIVATANDLVLPAMTENPDAYMPDNQVPLVAPGIGGRVGYYADEFTESVMTGKSYDTTPNVPIASTISKAVSGWQGNFAGVALIVGSLLVNPSFSDALGKFTVRLANGEGSWGALAALVGAGLIAYRGSQSK